MLITIKRLNNNVRCYECSNVIPAGQMLTEHFYEGCKYCGGIDCDDYPDVEFYCENCKKTGGKIEGTIQ